LSLAAAATSLCLAGCAGGDPKAGMREMPKPAEVQPPPPPKDVPVDAALQAEARRTLEEGFKSPEPPIRLHALEGMRQVTGEAAAPQVLQALKDGNSMVRFGGAMAAGELKVAAAKPSLLALLNDPSPSVRVGVRFALHRLGDTSRSHDLEKYALDPTPRVRRHTALALGLLGDKSGLNVLRPMRDDPDAGVRQQVAEAMWRLGAESALDELVGLTLSSAPDDQMFALLALAAPKVGRVRGVLRGKLTDDYLRTSLVAARAMGMLGSDEGYGVALNGAKSQDKEERFLAARAFGAIGRSDAQPILETLMKDASPEVRLAAASAVLQLRHE